MPIVRSLLFFNFEKKEVRYVDAAGSLTAGMAVEGSPVSLYVGTFGAGVAGIAEAGVAVTVEGVGVVGGVAGGVVVEAPVAEGL